MSHNFNFILMTDGSTTTEVHQEGEAVGRKGDRIVVPYPKPMGGIVFRKDSDLTVDGHVESAYCH